MEQFYINRGSSRLAYLSWERWDTKECWCWLYNLYIFSQILINQQFSPGRLSAKSDVYSYGVVLLELLTGRRALDKSRVIVEQSLVDWAKPYLGDRRKVFRIMDTKLEGQYPQKAAFTVATLALQCLNPEPRSRPKMSEVLEELEKLQDHKNSNKSSHGSLKSVSSPMKSPIRNHHTPMHLTPSASPLSSHRQSPRVR